MSDKSHLNIWLGMSIFLLAIVSTAGARIVFVDDDATGANDGSSWADAHNYLQDALVASLDSDEIWVAEGTYKPDQGGGQTAGDQTATFELKDGVALYGGFPSGGGNWEDRDPIAYETILSGDLAGDDGPDFANNAENSYHVVTSSGTDATAIFDGFIITAGNANGPWQDDYDHGGGMFNGGGTPTLTNCTFNGNSAYNSGGGMYNTGDPTLTNCTFIDNSTYDGGGMCNRFGSPTLTNCTFSGNSATYGGGMYIDSGNPTLTNCSFSGNSAIYHGGGMWNEDSDSMLTNCTFSGNLAGEHGGGINCAWYGSPTLTNCILWSNIAPSSRNEEEAQIDPSAPRMPVINYCCIQGWTGFLSGTGNVGDDPLFVDADGPDDTVGTADDDLRLSAGSPCIDAGDNTAIPQDTPDLDGDGDTAEPIPWDLDGNPRFLDDLATTDTGNGTPPIVDMGVHENIECLLHDWNDDGFISIIGDVPPFVDCVYFGNCPDWSEEFLLCVGDCNGDGFLSIIGDVPCFVDCVYFGNCPE